MITAALMYSSSCYGPPPKLTPIKAEENSIVLSAPYDAVWGRTVKLAATGGNEILFVNKSTGALSFQLFLSGDEITGYASDDASLYGNRLKVTVNVKELGERTTKVSTSCTFFCKSEECRPDNMYARIFHYKLDCELMAEHRYEWLLR